MVEILFKIVGGVKDGKILMNVSVCVFFCIVKGYKILCVGWLIILCNIMCLFICYVIDKMKINIMIFF